MKVFYEKRGRRYHPVSQYDGDLMLSAPEGAHLVMVTPGLKSTTYKVDPASAPLLAALRMNRQALVERLLKASEMQPCNGRGMRPLTDLERKAFEAYKAVAGPDATLGLQKATAHDIINALEDALIKAAA